MSICFLSLETSKVFNQLILNHLSKEGYQGLSVSNLLIFPYLENENDLSISKLAKKLNQSRQATHKSINKLCEFSYLILSQEQNKKEKIIKLDKRGKALLKEANNFIETLQNHLEKVIGKKELSSFIQNQDIIFDYLSSKLD